MHARAGGALNGQGLHDKSEDWTTVAILNVYITFSKDEPVYYGGDAGSGVADVDDQRRTLPRGKTERELHRLSAVQNKKKRTQTDAFRTPVFAM